ncbi:hypothetical protein M5689_024073 [Euphorbia peplus]|nr:hypothetical protein M5689_024073 [Euphorbia peplus]
MDSQRTVAILFIISFLSLFLLSPCQAIRKKSLSPSPSPSPSPSSSIPTLVKELCAKTAASEPFCIKTLTSDKLSWEAKNFVDLTKIFLSLGKNNAKHTQEYIGALTKGKGVTPETKKALDACADDYRYFFNNFGSALGEVEEGEYDIANYDIMVSFDGTRMCQTSLSDAKLSVKGISDSINVTTYFINIGATFTNIL